MNQEYEIDALRKLCAHYAETCRAAQDEVKLAITALYSVGAALDTVARQAEYTMAPRGVRVTQPAPEPAPTGAVKREGLIALLLRLGWVEYAHTSNGADVFCPQGCEKAYRSTGLPEGARRIWLSNDAIRFEYSVRREQTYGRLEWRYGNSLLYYTISTYDMIAERATRWLREGTTDESRRNCPVPVRKRLRRK